jgi:hypothetical protein
LYRGTQHHAANAAKSVDADFGGHGGFTFVQDLGQMALLSQNSGLVTILSELLKLCYLTPCAMICSGFVTAVGLV